MAVILIDKINRHLRSIQSKILNVMRDTALSKALQTNIESQKIMNFFEKYR